MVIRSLSVLSLVLAALAVSNAAFAQALDPETMRAASAIVDLRRQMNGPDLGAAQLGVVLERVRRTTVALKTMPTRTELVAALEAERQRLSSMWSKTTELASSRPNLAPRLPEFQSRFDELFAHIGSLREAGATERQATSEAILELIGRAQPSLRGERASAVQPTVTMPDPDEEESAQ